MNGVDRREREMGKKVHGVGDCTLECLLTHGRRNGHGPTVISFFKVILDPLSESLFLPPKFSKRVAVLMGHNTLLEDIRGHQWRVKLSILDGYWAFQQGWSDFVSDHSIDYGDFIVFNYIIGSHFIVQIFDKSCCERLNFTVRNNRNLSKEKKAGRIENLPDCLPSDDVFPDAMEAKHYIVNGDSMKEDVFERSRTTLSASSDFEVTKSKSNAKEEEKARTTEKSFQYCSGCKRQFDSTDTMIEKGSTSSTAVHLSVPEIASNCNAEDTQKMPMLTENSSVYQSGCKRTSDALEAPCHGILEDLINEEGAVKSKRAYSILPQFQMTKSKCDAADVHIVPIGTERYSHQNNSSKMDSGVSLNPINVGGVAGRQTSPKKTSTARELPCMIDGCLGNREFGNVLFGLSNSKMVKSNCCAEDMNSFVKEDLMNEEAALRKIYNFEVNENKCDNEDIVEVPSTTQNSSHPGHDSKMASVFSNRHGCVIDVESLDGERAVEIQTASTILSGDEIIKNICDSEITGEGPTTSEKTSHYRGGCNRTFDNSDYEGSHKLLTAKVSCFMIGTDLVDEERALRTGTAASNSFDFEVVESKRDSEDMDHLTTSTEKPSNCSCMLKGSNDATPSIEKSSTFCMLERTSGALQCRIIDEDSMTEEATRRGKTSSKLYDYEAGENRCIVEEINHLPGSTEESSHSHLNNAGGPNTAPLTGNIKILGNLSVSGAIGAHPLSVEFPCTSTGNKPTIKPKMEYAPDFGSIRTDLQKAVNMDECHKYPATIEEKDCHSGEVPYAAVEEWMDVDAFLKDELKVCRVKEEGHLDTLPDSVTFSCSASTEHQSWLELPTILPPFMFKGGESLGKKVVFLLDSAKRVWPVLYLGMNENYYQHKCFSSGWKDFAAANNIHLGDTCIFEAVNGSNDMLQVRIRKE